MRTWALIAASLTLLAGCDRSEIGVQPSAQATQAVAASSPAQVSDTAVVGKWDLQSSGEGVALVYLTSGTTALRLFCPARATELIVSVPDFKPIASEERLSFGSGGEAVTLVADSRGDLLRGGVSGTGPVPGNLAALVRGPVAASYGRQISRPAVAPPSQLASGFISSCSEGARLPAREQPPAKQPGACRTQDGQPLRNPSLRAVGTEPFWGGSVEGRCVTYTHPEDQAGTRVWTRYTPGPASGGIWSGTLGNRLFELKVRPQANCSDGMSDRRYAYAVELAVGGERHRGCADLR